MTVLLELYCDLFLQMCSYQMWFSHGVLNIDFIPEMVDYASENYLYACPFYYSIVIQYCIELFVNGNS